MRFECDYPDCNRSYLRKEHLSRHQRNHANLRSFACAACPATFNRSDLLHRHEALNHGQPADPVDPVVAEGSSGAVTLSGPSNILPKIKESAGPTYLDLSAKSRSELLDDPDRVELQNLYFTKFHTDWPILDKDDFYHTPQPPSLVLSVLVVGMYMKGTPEANSMALKYHEVLIKSALHFFNVIMPLVPTPAPRLDLLPEIQILMLPHLFTLLENMGVFDQRRIDAEVSSETHREQYQRLALMQLKLYLHVSTLIIERNAQFTLNSLLSPAKVNVRVPVLGRTKLRDAGGAVRRGPSLLVGSLFAKDADPRNFRDISEIDLHPWRLGYIAGHTQVFRLSL
ncbi:Zinc finger protein zas1 like [Verticillium longisporum]|nr:Zinc finger protein zas1 like [Verticillium longisporum]